MENNGEHPAPALDGSELPQEADQIEHFIHRHGMKPKVVFGSPGDSLRAVLVRLEIVVEGNEGGYVFVGECDEALSEAIEVEDGADAHAPVDIDLTLEVLEVHRHRHVHHHHCRHVAVEVNFGGREKRHRFSPATTIDVVTQWARRKFPNLDPAAAAEYVLQVVETKAQPRADQHIGEIVAAGTCSVRFNLVKEITPQG